MVGMNAPMAMRIVAGHAAVDAARDERPGAPGSDATRLTTMATGAMSRLNRKWSPGWFGSSE